MYRFSPSLHHTAAAVCAVLALLGSRPAIAQCEGTTSIVEIQAELAKAESALAALDASAFRSLVDETGLLLPCLNEPVSPRLAANLHRVIGIRAVGDRDPLAERAFAAARHIEPNYQFSLSLIPEGNPVREAYDTAPYHKRSTEAVQQPESGQIYVDGTPSDTRPLSWPAVIQWVDGEDDVRFSEYVLPGEALPVYPEWRSTTDSDRPPIALIATSLGLGAVSAGLYGVALAEQARYKDTVNQPVPYDELEGLRRTTNGLVVASALGATAAVGTGVAVVIAW